MKLPAATDKYDRANQQANRNEVQNFADRAVTRDVAENFILLIDQDTGEAGKLTVESGAFIWTAL